MATLLATSRGKVRQRLGVSLGSDEAVTSYAIAPLWKVKL
jgi:hypothetical protein